MKVLLIDDDPLVTNGIKTILEAEGKKRESLLDVCATGANGIEAVDLYKIHKPDIILMDIRMPEMNGLEAAKEILDYDGDSKIIFLTTFLEDDYIVKALKLGAKGYIIKTDFQTLFPALEAVYNGQRIFGDEIIERIPDFIKADSSINFENLSEKENDLIYWVAQGLSNQEIAEEMHFSEGTIRNYISALLEKLELRNRTELAVYYYKNI